MKTEYGLQVSVGGKQLYSRSVGLLKGVMNPLDKTLPQTLVLQPIYFAFNQDLLPFATGVANYS